MNTIHVEKKELLKWNSENGISFGTAKNGCRYAEVVVDSPAFNLLKGGLKIIATRSKTGSVTTYEFTGEYGKEYFDYHHNKKVRFYGTEIVKLANK